MIEHISVSSLSTYWRCPMQWYYRYVEKKISPPGIAALVGSGVHKGLQHAMLHKIATGANLSPKDVQDAAVAGFDERLGKDGCLLTPDEISQGTEIVIGGNRDRVAVLAVFAGEQVVPDYQPLGAELEFTLPTEQQLGVPLVGIVDVVEEGRVSDFKTGKRRLSQRDLTVSPQLTAYSLYVHRQQKSAPEVRLDQLVDRSKKPPERVLLSGRRTRADYEMLIRRAKVTLDAIRAGNFPPCDPTHWTCSKRWCGYTSGCPFYVPELDEAE